MRLLMKSCEDEHLIDRCDWIRLGTFSYFRKHLDPEIGDSTEGLLHTSLQIAIPSVFPARVLNAIWQGGMGFGDGNSSSWLRRPFQMRTNYLHIDKPIGGNVHISRCSVEYTTAGSDALIFCMTSVNSPSAAPRVGYPARWFMKEANAGAFARIMQRDLNAKFASDPSQFVDTKYLAMRGKAKFTVVHGHVTYRDKHVALINPSIRDLTKLARTLRDCDMVKIVDYSHQNEYRFCARLVLGGVVLPLKSGLEHMFIASHDFRKLL